MIKRKSQKDRKEKSNHKTMGNPESPPPDLEEHQESEPENSAFKALGEQLNYEASHWPELGDAIEAARDKGLVPGVRVRLTHDREVGVIEAFNKEKKGVYSGRRYPLLVKFKRGILPFGIEDLQKVPPDAS